MGVPICIHLASEVSSSGYGKTFRPLYNTEIVREEKEKKALVLLGMMLRLIYSDM